MVSFSCSSSALNSILIICIGNWLAIPLSLFPWGLIRKCLCVGSPSSCPTGELLFLAMDNRMICWKSHCRADTLAWILLQQMCSCVEFDPVNIVFNTGLYNTSREICLPSCHSSKAASCKGHRISLYLPPPFGLLKFSVFPLHRTLSSWVKATMFAVKEDWLKSFP